MASEIGLSKNLDNRADDYFHVFSHCFYVNAVLFIRLIHVQWIAYTMALSQYVTSTDNNTLILTNETSILCYLNESTFSCRCVAFASLVYRPNVGRGGTKFAT